MLTPVKIQKIELSSAFTACYLGSEDRLFVIFLPSSSGKLLQQLIAHAPLERPSSFDVMLSLLAGNSIKPLQVVIDDEKEGIYFTKIFLEKDGDDFLEILEIDAKPSESLALAIKFQIPLFVTTELLERLPNLNETVLD